MLTSPRISSAYRKPLTCWRHHAAFTEGMSHPAPARFEARRVPRLVLVGLAVVIATIIGTLGDQSVSSSATSFGDVLRGDHHGALGEADGLVPDGASVFDDETPAVANLEPSLLKALRRAATDAAKDGVEFQVNSGWRSPEYQEQLFREAVSEYGSVGEAERWVATANTSAHVSGDAVDIGPSAATAWLSEHGARYGLCQIYRNEPWHYELRPEATSRRCPRMNADSTQDPRMER
jgi:D-alanyl-D-alanine carboxypeptidase